MMFNWTDLILLLFVLFLQIRNMKQYGLKNGAGFKRIVMMLSVLFLVIHVVRLMFDITTGLFLLLHVITWVFIYDIGVKEFFISVWKLIVKPVK